MQIDAGGAFILYHNAESLFWPKFDPFHSHIMFIFAKKSKGTIKSRKKGSKVLKKKTQLYSYLPTLQDGQNYQNIPCLTVEKTP